MAGPQLAALVVPVAAAAQAGLGPLAEGVAAAAAVAAALRLGCEGPRDRVARCGLHPGLMRSCT